MSAQALINALYTKLTTAGVGTFSEAVGARIYNGEPPEPKPTTLFPYCVFTLVSAVPTRHFGGAVSLDALVQFDLYNLKTDHFQALGDIETKLHSLLDGVSITPSGFDRGLCTFENRMSQSIEEDACRITDELLIRGTDF